MGKKMILNYFLLCLFTTTANAVPLNEILNVHILNTVKVRTARLDYVNSRMAYENYRKGFLPSVRFGISPLSFNRSLRLLQNPLSGDYSYVNDYSNTSSADVTVTQRIGVLGGTLTASSGLGYLREFSYNRNSFSTSPLFIGYSQPLRGGRREYVYTRNIERMRFVLARKRYAVAFAEERQTLASLYMSLFVAQTLYSNAVKNVEICDTLLALTKLKLENGQITRYDYTQIEMQRLDAAIELERQRHTLEDARLDLCAELGVDSITVEDVHLAEMPAKMSLGEVKRIVGKNNPQILQQAFQMEQARLERYKARMDTRFGGSVSLTYGLNQYAETFAKAYRSPDRRQAVAVTFSIPVFQWGINANKRRIADNGYEQTKIAVEHGGVQFWQSVSKLVAEYNMAMASYNNVLRHSEVAAEQYDMAMERYALGQISTFELTTAYRQRLQAEQGCATARQSACNAYYSLCRVALYDFVRQCDMEDVLDI